MPKFINTITPRLMQNKRLTMLLNQPLETRPLDHPVIAKKKAGPIIVMSLVMTALPACDKKKQVEGDTQSAQPDSAEVFNSNDKSTHGINKDATSLAPSSIANDDTTLDAGENSGTAIITNDERTASLSSNADVSTDVSTEDSMRDLDTAPAINAGAKPIISSNLTEEEKRRLLERQVTEVTYRNSEDKMLKVTYQTSAVEALEANVTLPSGKQIVLTAPKDEGNNPTYRSANGSIELVTHGGGGSIDLVSNGKSSSFDAVSAEAEVITPP